MRLPGGATQRFEWTYVAGPAPASVEFGATATGIDANSGAALSGDADVGLLAAMTDGVILLVRSGSTSIERLRTALDRLQATGVPVFGLILSMGASRRRPGR